MAVIDVTESLGAIVTEHPALARELERRGLDYCCGGGRTLAEACAEAGLDPDALAAELAAAAGPGRAPRWATLGIADLADHIETVHHRYLWSELPRLTTLLERVVGVHGDRHPELHEVAELLAELRADLEPHLVKEERVLFPMIRQLAVAEYRPSFHCGRIGNPIAVMTAEHEGAGELLARLRAATNGYRAPADGCLSYRRCYEGLAELEADTHLHVHKENNALFPAAVKLEESLPGAPAVPGP
jgi:regulator of cell morphogenesis and NO signaling